MDYQDSDGKNGPGGVGAFDVMSFACEYDELRVLVASLLKPALCAGSRADCSLIVATGCILIFAGFFRAFNTLQHYTDGFSISYQLPGYMGAYSKMMAGWLNPIEITQNGFYAIMPAEGMSYILIPHVLNQ